MDYIRKSKPQADDEDLQAINQSADLESGASQV